MLPATTGARPGKINMMFSPNSANPRLFPERKPSPSPPSSSNDPTPQATPNMVRNERSLCAHSVRKICAKMSSITRITTLYLRGDYPLFLSRPDEPPSGPRNSLQIVGNSKMSPLNTPGFPHAEKGVTLLVRRSWEDKD